jgi:hypothetical protein
MKIKHIYKNGDVGWLYNVGDVVRFRHNIEWIIDSINYNNKLDRTSIKLVQNNKHIFIISPVRGVSEGELEELREYCNKLENMGYRVHLPIRDTKQDQDEMSICTQNMEAIKKADEIHVYYNSSSRGIHFDLGMAFALNKKIVVVKNEIPKQDKCFARFLDMIRYDNK